MKWEDELDVGGLTDLGMRRSNNQDSYRALLATSREQWESRGHVFVVADGMGAHAVGELASKLAVDAIPHSYHKLKHLPSEQAIARSFQDANVLIHNRGTANRDFQGMGTTSTALLLLPDGALIAHVGDSRAYRVRDGRIQQLSFDHSLAWELVRRRHLTEAQAREMVPANVITRSLGPEPEVQVDVEGPLPIQPGDVFVLCSDGLSGQVDDADIGAIARSLPAQQACQYLVDLANLRGGPDNITVVVVRVGEPIADPPAVTPPAARRLPPIPWKSPDLYLVLGAVIMLGAFLWGPVFGRNTPSFGFVYAWLVGWLLVVTGIAWRFLAKVRVEQPPAPEPRGYRDTPCALDDTLFQRLNSRLDQLRSLAIDEVWSMDWSQFFTCRNSGDKLLAAGDRTAALREFCQALHRLAIAQRRHQTSTHGLLGRQ